MTRAPAGQPGGMYRIALGPVVYENTYTLPGALREVYGVMHADILRLDDTVAVRNAGSAYAVEHVSGRTIVRGPRRNGSAAYRKATR